MSEIPIKKRWIPQLKTQSGRTNKDAARTAAQGWLVCDHGDTATTQRETKTAGSAHRSGKGKQE